MAIASGQLAGWLQGRTASEQNAIMRAYCLCQLEGIIRHDLADLSQFCPAADHPADPALLDRVVRPLLVAHDGGLTFPDIRHQLQRQDATRARWRRQKAAQRSRQSTPPRYVHMDTPENVHVDTKPPLTVRPHGQQNVHADTSDGVHADITQTSCPQHLASHWSNKNVHADTPPARACSTNSRSTQEGSNMAASAAAASLEVNQGEQLTSSEHAETARDEPLSARQRLLDHGMNPKTAHRLVARYGASRCAEQADYLQFKRTELGHPVRNPAGYLRRAIEIGYRRPGGYVSPAERSAARHEHARRRAERARQQQEAEVRKAARAGFYRTLAQRWARLGEAERVELVRAMPGGYTPRHLIGTVDAYDHLATRLGYVHPDDLPLGEALRWAQSAPAPTVGTTHQGRCDRDDSQGGQDVPLARSG